LLGIWRDSVNVFFDFARTWQYHCGAFKPLRTDKAGFRHERTKDLRCVEAKD
jgi:hypothetical protein